MMQTHSLFDHLLVAVLLAAPLINRRWGWPRYLRRLAAGVPGARLKFLRGEVAAQWVLTLSLLAAWATLHRPWVGLILGGGFTLRLALGLAFAALLIGVLWLQRRAILRRPKAVERLRVSMAHAEPLLPHTAAERRLFWLVSATAGACEEILFRGFLTWYFAVWVGPVAAVLLSSAVFGFGHIYLGWKRVPQTALLGLFFALIALATGSLWPAMVLHAAIDWNSGELGFRLLSQPAALQEH